MTNSIERRLQEHHEGLAPGCYTFPRRPVILKYTETYQYVKDAIAREKQIKGWSRKKKEALIIGDYDELRSLARNGRQREEGFSSVDKAS